MPTIAKRHISTTELLGLYLSFTPNADLVGRFGVDMRTLNPTLLRDSILEGVAARGLHNIAHDQQRLLLHSIYTRKVKELSSLYPFIFAVENGLRSTLADHLEDYFGRADWWTLIRDGHRNGNPSQHFQHVHGVAAKQPFIKAVWNVFEQMVDPKHIGAVTGPDKCDEFFYVLTFGQLWNLIRSDWALARLMFATDVALGYNLNMKVFNDAMAIIKEGRNEIFHGNPIKERGKFVGTCERLLDAMSFHLGDYDTDLAASVFTRVAPSIAREKRHIIPAR